MGVWLGMVIQLSICLITEFLIFAQDYHLDNLKDRSDFSKSSENDDSP